MLPNECSLAKFTHHYNLSLCRYTGEWVNGKINGKGEIYTINCSIKQYSNANAPPLLSSGTIYLSSGDQYTGDWKDGRRHGNVVYKYK